MSKIRKVTRKNYRKIKIVSLLSFLLVFHSLSFCLAEEHELSELFQNPPHDALPRGYWVWPHGNFDYSTIKSELKAFKDKGLGGVDIFDLGVRDRRDVIPPGPGFLSQEQIDGIAFALQEAKELDLKIGLIVSSSWNAGGTWTEPKEALMNLVSWSENVQGPVQYKKQIPFPDYPEEFAKPYGKYKLYVPKGEDGLPEFYEEVALLAFPVSGNRIVATEEDVRTLSGKLDVDGILEVDIPEGEWVIMRLVCTNFGQRLWLPSDRSQGLIMDHFSKQATRKHFQTVIDRLQERTGPLKDTALERLYLASYESDAEVIWTPTFPEEFKERNGYNIEPFLPALFGYVIQDQEHTDRFLYDFRRTVSDVFVENLYLEASAICRDHGLLLCSESGGPGPPLHNVPTEDLKALGAVDVMRGEFWNREDRWKDKEGFDLTQVVKAIASAAHIYGHKIVEMEAFTSHINWQEGPSVFKPLADRAFCEGMNRVVYHTMSHNLPEAGKPGWTYQAGTHMNTNLTWWPLSDQLHVYLTRCSAMLQHGRFVADACFYYGHEIPNFTKPKHIRPALGPGFEYDDLNTEILLTADVRDGRIVLPGGMQYEVLVLPESPKMDLAVIEKIEALLQKGATVVGPKPSRIYGLKGYPYEEDRLREIANRIWGEGEAQNTDRAYGNGRIIYGKTVREVLLDKDIVPDLQIIGVPYENIDFIHRHSEEGEIYFIRNAGESAISFDALFRVQNRIPEMWNAVSEEMKICAIYRVEEQGIRLPIHLNTQESLFVVFRKELNSQPNIQTVRHSGEILFPLSEGSRSASRRFVGFRDQEAIVFQADSAGDYTFSLSDNSEVIATIHPIIEFTVRGAWDVRFPYGWGVSPLQTFDSLYSWTGSSDAGIRSFSGIATYRKTIELEKEHFDGREKILLDLGEVREVARVYLNGHDLGISGFAPHTFDVTHVLRSGENYLVVEVANTWLNRLIADDQRPEDQRLTHTNLTEGPTTSQPWKNAQPHPSGLLGPVHLQGISIAKVQRP